MSAPSPAPGAGMFAAAWENVTRERDGQVARLARLEADRQAVHRYGGSGPYEPDYPVGPVAALGLVPAARVEEALAAIEGRLGAVEGALGVLPRMLEAVQGIADAIPALTPGIEEALGRLVEGTEALDRALREPIARIEEGVAGIASRLDAGRAPAAASAVPPPAALPIRVAPPGRPAPRVPEAAEPLGSEPAKSVSTSRKVESFGDPFLISESPLFYAVEGVLMGLRSLSRSRN